MAAALPLLPVLCRLPALPSLPSALPTPRPCAWEGGARIRI